MNENTANILIVEDDEIWARLLRRILAEDGYRATAVDSIAGAEAAIADDRFDLGLIDIQLPDGSGLELIRRFQRHQAHMPLIIMTSASEIDIAVQCFKEGAAEFLDKPIHHDRLREAVRDALATAARQTRLPGTAQAPLPEAVGSWQILRVLGEGNMGVIYLAEPRDAPAGGRPYALKMLKPQQTDAPRPEGRLTRRFLNSARAMFEFDHPNIIPVVDYDLQEDHLPFLVMEYFPAETLQQYCARHRLALTQTCALLAGVADGLHALHARGICHRDVKPQNILVNDELQVKLTDFGIARLKDSGLTQSDELLGTPAYLAPEGFAGGAITTRADVFSLGVVACELFTGRRAFPGETFADIRSQVLDGRPAWPRELDPDFPFGLDAIVRRMLARDPDARCDCDEVARIMRAHT